MSGWCGGAWLCDRITFVKRKGCQHYIRCHHYCCCTLFCCPPLFGLGRSFRLHINHSCSPYTSFCFDCYLLAVLQWASAVFLPLELRCSLEILLPIVPLRSVALVPGKHLPMIHKKPSKTCATATTTEQTGLSCTVGISRTYS